MKRVARAAATIAALLINALLNHAIAAPLTRADAATDPGPRTAVARALAGTGHDFAASIIPYGGDFIVAGLAATTTRDFPILVRLNAAGTEIWTRKLTDVDGALSCVRMLDDSTLVAVGWTQRDSTNLDAFAARFDPAGNPIWTRTYHGPSNERLWSLDLTPNGIIAAGEAMSANGSASQAFVLRFDRNGNETGRALHGGKPVERVFSVQSQPDGGYVLAGSSGSGPRESPGYDARITRYDSSDKLKWSREWGGAAFDVAHDVERLPNGGLIVAGYTFADSVRHSDAFLLQLSAAGDVQWSRTYGDERDDRVTHVAVLPDGGFAMVGYSREAGGPGANGSRDGYGPPDLTLRATDSRGELRWERDFGGAGPELGRSVVATAGGGIAAIGHSGSYGALERVYFVRLDNVSAAKMAQAP